MSRPVDLTPRQAEVLGLFYRHHCHFKGHRARPHIGDIRKALGIGTRAGVYCAHLVPLMGKGYLIRDKPPFERRGYCITLEGVRAYRKWKELNGHDAKQDSVDTRDSPGSEVPQDGGPATQ